MASPKLVTDGVSEWEEAVANRALMSDGTKIEVKVWHGRLYYSGADTIVHASVDFAGVTSAAVVFNAGDTTFDITLSGFTNPPAIILTKSTPSAYEPHLFTTPTNVLARVGFSNIDTGAAIATGTEDADMDFNILIIGN